MFGEHRDDLFALDFELVVQNLDRLTQFGGHRVGQLGAAHTRVFHVQAALADDIAGQDVHVAVFEGVFGHSVEALVQLVARFDGDLVGTSRDQKAVAEVDLFHVAVIHREGVFEQHQELHRLVLVGDAFQGPDEVFLFFRGGVVLAQRGVSDGGSVWVLQYRTPAGRKVYLGYTSVKNFPNGVALTASAKVQRQDAFENGAEDGVTHERGQVRVAFQVVQG